MEFEGYCVKCREKRTIEKGEVKDTPNGRQMAQGKCPVCGTTVTRFMAGGGSGNGGGEKAGGAKASGGSKSGSGSKGKAAESGSGKSSRSSK